LDVYRPPEKREAFVREVLRRASAISGVRYAAAGAGGGVPLSPQRNRAPFTIEELPMTSGTEPVIQFTSVSPDYFKVLGASLQSGRFFHEGDGRMSGLVALVDETMATRYWPNQNPIGKRLKFGRRESKSGWIEVIGVVANMKTDGFDAPDEPHVYVPIYQNPNYSMAVYVRTEGDPSIVAESLRREVQAVDPDLPIFGEQTMETIVSAHLAERRFAMTMVTVFGAAALLLAAIGIYGVMSYSVNQRTREIGIRMAVGAESSDIMRWVLRQGLLLTSVGVGLGLVGALVLTRLMRDLLFQVAATDLLTYSGVAVVLAIVALAACLIPARRATKVDPIVALRCE
jgi:putative ABC transport system permease protein